MDIGCGSGDELERQVVPAAERVIGVDQPSGISLAAARFDSVEWCAGDFAEPGLRDQLRENAPDLVLCADVIEHVEHPAALLDGLRGLLRDESVAVISTPDRARWRDARPLGPPLNPRHVRERSAEEMELLLESADLEIVERRHVLPRG
jgi:2-polyprenyl-3-methyl-5-hydroxy-6-metoxy-1,4-benzoquinol methylase